MTKPDATLALIAARFTRYDVKKSGKGYAIIDRRTANPIARLCPIPKTDRFELFYWSNTKGRWTTFGNLGRMKLMLESAHEIVENDPMFRVPRYRMDHRGKRKHNDATAAVGATAINDRIGAGLGWVLNRLLRTARLGRG
jgi:hypothetical protein